MFQTVFDKLQTGSSQEAQRLLDRIRDMSTSKTLEAIIEDIANESSSG